MRRTWRDIHHYLGYGLRPLWGTPPKPFTLLPHYYAPNISFSVLCPLHNWGNPLPEKRKVFDAVPLSIEVDLLELRIRELWDVVDEFIVVESNSTFTGLPKPQSFSWTRFSFAKPKLHYRYFNLRTLKPHEKAFDLEYETRVVLDDILRERGVKHGDVVIMADTDEIPSAHTVHLYATCEDPPKTVHLQLKEYLYSFEFPTGFGSWRASLNIWQSPNNPNNPQGEDRRFGRAGAAPGRRRTPRQRPAYPSSATTPAARRPPEPSHFSSSPPPPGGPGSRSSRGPAIPGPRPATPPRPAP
ncbi:hypothetical protein HK102_007370 [Quaeritorhiza haematococci]|nr:hypothetical protein HK102_007370 [Quaeritorhiza haematococci]